MENEASRLEQLLVDARSGDVYSLGMALESFRTYLSVIANQEFDESLRAKAGASDIVQQTFVDAHRDFAQFRGERSEEFKGWLRQILRNNLANFRRDFQDTEKRDVTREVRPDSKHSSAWLVAAATGETPSQIVSEDEEERRVDHAIARLPEEYRQVIELRYRSEFTFSEIAAVMGKTENAARKLWVRAVEALGKELGPT